MNMHASSRAPRLTFKFGGLLPVKTFFWPHAHFNQLPGRKRRYEQFDSPIALYDRGLLGFHDEFSRPILRSARPSGNPPNAGQEGPRSFAIPSLFLSGCVFPTLFRVILRSIARRLLRGFLIQRISPGLGQALAAQGVAGGEDFAGVSVHQEG